MRVFLTGFNGFVGRGVANRLLLSPHVLTVASRRAVPGFASSVFYYKGLSEDQSWKRGLENQQVVIHAAARVDSMDGPSADRLTEFRKINVLGTLNLARQAAEAGVKRFIFISSIKVNGEGTNPGRPYMIADAPSPVDPYGISKMEAEQGLREISQESGMEVVVIRPVLVYGPGVKGNFLSMINWLQKGVPLPLGAVHNKRSLVSLDNLVDLIVTCIDHPGAANQILFVSDGEDLSTVELLRAIGEAMGKPARLLPVPAGLLQFGAILVGKKAIAQRLLGSLQVDISKTCELLDWKPPYTVEEGLRRCFEKTN